MAKGVPKERMGPEPCFSALMRLNDPVLGIFTEKGNAGGQMRPLFL
jgi:hypothetical protein